MMKPGQMYQGKQPSDTKLFYLVYARKSSEAEDRQISSIDDQLRELQPLVKKDNTRVLKTFSEARSAKAPGRLEFNKMIDLIQSRDDIKGIICWKLNRLSRNPIDTGQLQWLLQTGKIDEIITPGKTYEEADSDFVMAVEGAQANRFIRDLKEDTARGIRTKLEKGWKPGSAPTGYKNNTHMKQGEKTISPGPYFTLIRKIFDYALTGNYSIQGLVVKAKELGVETNRGSSISKTQMASTLKNPFYTGKFVYAGKLYQGKHKPMLMAGEFEILQEIFSSKSKPRKQKNTFPLTGLILCGECGMMITAEQKTKHYKNGISQTFGYYRCTKKSKTHKCKQPYLATGSLEKQALAFLSTLEISPLFVQWVGKWLNNERKQENGVKEKARRSLQRQLDDTKKKILAVVETRLIDNSFQAEDVETVYNRLKLRKTSLQEKIASIDTNFDELNELTLKTFDFASKARERFENGTPEDKKTILRAIGSNLVLKDRKLLVEPKTPFLMIKRALASYPAARTYKRGETQDKCIEAFSVNAPLGRLKNDVRTYYSTLLLKEKQEMEAGFNHQFAYIPS